MTLLKPFTLSSGAEVFVEVPDDRSVVRTGSRTGEALGEATSSLVTALAPVSAAADDAIGELSKMSARPARVELAFAVRLTTEAKAVIAKVGGEAQISVTVVWERQPGTAS